jgi:hypothetical protein
MIRSFYGETLISTFLGKYAMKNTEAERNLWLGRSDDEHQSSSLREKYSCDANIFIFERNIPSWIEPEMESLYNCLYSTLKKFRIYDDLKDAGTYIIENAGEISNILVFRVVGQRIFVMNELIQLSQIDVDQYCAAMFDKFKAVSVISFTAVETNIQKLKIPFQKSHRTEDFVVNLPSTPELYLASLSSSTKKDIKYKINKLHRDFPSFQCVFLEKEEVIKHHILKILEFHQERMVSRDIVSIVDLTELNASLRLIQDSSGFVALAMIDGQICGGLVVHSAGTGYFMSLIAHDPDYNRYSLGMVCCYLTICECIKRGGRKFHLLWGRSEYKRRLSGVPRPLSDLNIYRSVFHLVLNWRLWLKSAWKTGIGKIRLWMISDDREENWIFRHARKIRKYTKVIG